MSDSDANPPPPPPPPPPPAEDRPGEPELFPGLLGGGGEGNKPPVPAGRKRSYKERREEMGFFEHLEELRMTIIKSAMAAAVGMGIMSLFFAEFFDFLRKPLEIALGPDQSKVPLISIQPMGVIQMVISVTIYGGVVLALPVIVYFFATFVAPGLTVKEKGMLRPGLCAALALFFVGALTCFYVLLPAGLKVNFLWSDKLGIENHMNAPDYYSLVIWATLAMGLVFEFPLILVILQVLGIIGTDTLRSGRRYAVVIIALIGGFIAPSPSIDSMIMTAAPMYLLYEGSIIIGARLRKRRLAAQAREEAANSG